MHEAEADQLSASCARNSQEEEEEEEAKMIGMCNGMGWKMDFHAEACTCDQGTSLINSTPRVYVCVPCDRQEM